MHGGKAAAQFASGIEIGETELRPGAEPKYKFKNVIMVSSCWQQVENVKKMVETAKGFGTKFYACYSDCDIGGTIKFTDVHMKEYLETEPWHLPAIGGHTQTVWDAFTYDSDGNGKADILETIFGNSSEKVEDNITIVDESGRDLHANKEYINEMLYSIDYAIHLADKYEINTEDKSDREILKELAIKLDVDEEKMSTSTDQELVEEIVNKYKTQLAQASGTDPLSEDKGVETTTEVETEQITEPVTEAATEVVTEPVTEPTKENELVDKIASSVNSAFDILTNNIKKLNNKINETSEKYETQKDLKILDIEKIKEILNRINEGSIGKDNITIVDEFGRDLHVNKEIINEMFYTIDYAIHLADKYEINTEDKSDRKILEELAIKVGVDEEKMSTSTDQELIEEIVNRHKTQLAQASGTYPLSEDKGNTPTTEVETEQITEPVTEVTTEVQSEPEPVTEPTTESTTNKYKIQPEKPTDGLVEVCKIAMEKGIPFKSGEKPSEFISRVAKELNIQITTSGKPKNYETLIKEILDKNKDIDIDIDKDKNKPNGENTSQLNKPSSNTGSVPTADNELNIILKAAENFANETSSSNYICLVLNQAGYLTKEQLNEYKNYNIDDIFEKFDELGWKKITNISNFRVGDIVLIDNNGQKIVQIYAGDNKWYVQGKSETQELSSDYFENLNWQAYIPQK